MPADTEKKQKVPQYQLDAALQRAASDHGSDLATICNGHVHTWTQLDDHVEGRARILRASGVRVGDRVAAISGNSDWYMELFFAVWRIGAVIVPLNCRWSVSECVFALRDCGARTLFLDDKSMELSTEIAAELPEVRIFRLEAVPPATFDGNDVFGNLADSSFGVGPQSGDQDLAAIYYTGGTTGAPKGVMLSHANIMSNASGFAPLTGLDTESVYLHGPPLFHMAAGGPLVMLTMLCGTQIFIDRFDPVQTLTAIHNCKVTHALLVPSMVEMLLDEAERGEFDLSSLEVLIYGASPMPEKLIKRAMSMLPHTSFLQAYGQTELAPVATVLLHEDHLSGLSGVPRLKSAGRPIPNCQVVVTNENGATLPKGAIGEIRVYGPNVMLGYWNRPELTSETIVDNWCLTGDLGYLDESDYLYIVDRAKDMIITGAENVYSAEVEGVLLRHPRIQQCAVIGIPSKRWGEQVHAVIVPKDECEISLEEIRSFCQKYIASYKSPRSISIRREPLPLSAAGKILKRELRDPFWQGLDRRIG